MISLFATQNSKTNLIYVNSSYKVYAEPTEDFVAVFQIDKSTPLIYCRKLSFKQDCSETLSEIKKTREEKPFGF